MTEREKVIKALECKVADNPCKPPCNPMDCDYAEKVWLNDTEDYDGYFCDTRRLMADALELLKAQEPRVMTSADLANAEPKTVVWCEQRDEIRTYLMPMIKYDNDLFENRFLVADPRAAELPNMRFWAARPTEEQREAVKWDD